MVRWLAAMVTRYELNNLEFAYYMVIRYFLLHMKRTKKLKVGIAPDSFKGTLSSLGVAVRIEKGLKKAIPGISAVKIPVADGGEGTVQAIVESTGGRFVTRTVKGPLGAKVEAQWRGGHGCKAGWYGATVVEHPSDSWILVRWDMDPTSMSQLRPHQVRVG